MKAAGEGKPRTRLAGLAQDMAAARGWRRRAIAFAAGAVSTLAFAPFFAWPVMFVTFPVLVWMLDGAVNEQRPLRAAFGAAWWFGFGYFFAGLFWVGEAFLVEAEIFAWLIPFAVTALPAGLALFWGLAGAASERACTRLGLRKPGIPPHTAALARVLMLAVVLTAAEWLRGHALTGFPWDPPGVALTYPLALMQAVSVFGIYGLTLWAVVIFASPLVVMAVAEPGEQAGAVRLAAISSALPLALAFIAGSWHLSAPASPPLPGVKLRVVQPSIAQREKWMAEKQAGIFQTHLDLSRRNGDGVEDGLDGITHVVWPEAAMPFGPLDHPEALGAIGALLGNGRYLLAGGLRAESDVTAPWGRRAYNSLMVFGAGGTLVTLYDKVHLVPFGEYLPFQAALEAIGLQSLTRQRGGFAAGKTPKQLLNVPGLPPVSPLICYEAIFPGEVAPGGERPGAILIITNDGWFGNTSGPQQHFHQARLRAVEQGVSLVRAANNGVSAVVDPEGRTISSVLLLNQRGTIDSALPAPRKQTLYALLGETIFLFNALIYLAIVAFMKRPRRNVQPAQVTMGTPG